MQTLSVDVLLVGVEDELQAVESATSVFRYLHTSVREAIAEPHEGHSTCEDTNASTQDIVALSVNVPTESKTWACHEGRTDVAVGLIPPPFFLGIGVEGCILSWFVEEDRNVETQSVGELEPVGHVPLVLSIEAQLSGSELGCPTWVARYLDVGLVVVEVAEERSVGLAGLGAEVIVLEVVVGLEIVATIEVLDEEVAELVELVVGSEGECVVSAKPCEVVLYGVDVLVKSISHRRIFVSDVHGSTVAAHSINGHTGEWSARGALVANTHVGSTCLVAEGWREPTLELGDERVGLRLEVVEMVKCVDGGDVALSKALLGSHKTPSNGELVEVVKVPVEFQTSLIALDIAACVSIFAVVGHALVGCQFLHLRKDVVGEVGRHLRALGAKCILVGILLVGALVVGKEEEFVFHDGTAQREAEEIFLFILVRVRIGTVGVLIVLTHKLLIVAIAICATMEVVGTALGDGVDGTSRETSLTNVIGSHVDLNLLYGLHTDGLGSCLTAIATARGETEDVVVHGTVDLERVVAVVGSGKRHRARHSVGGDLGIQTRDVGNAMTHGRHVVNHLRADALGGSCLRGV